MSRSTITLMLAGDVMTGRGIDQVLPHLSPPELFEHYVKSARDYVTIAEEANGPIAAPVSFPYIWGEALEALAWQKPDLRIVNLETAVTTSEQPWPKGINYRMNPANLPCLTAAAIDCCVLSNNHVIDWGREGLAETLSVLHKAGIATAGAGRDVAEASAPAVFAIPGGRRVVVYGFGCPSSGVPAEWAAGPDRSGVNYLARPSAESATAIAEEIKRARWPGDIVVVSIHWDVNWGYDVADDDRAFAHRLVEAGAADVVHGHSSHHPKAIEVHHGKPILYGCGDLLNDYEGIKNHEPYRDDLTLIYLVSFDVESGRLAGLDMMPFHVRNFRLNRPDREEAEWLRQTMDRECRRYRGAVRLTEAGILTLSWS